MGSRLGQLALGKDKYPVRMPYGRKPVRDDNARPFRQQAFNAALDQLLGLGIDGTRSLVQYDYLRIVG